MIRKVFGCFSAAVLAVFVFAGWVDALAQDDVDEQIYLNAKVFTGDPLRPYAEAVGVREGKIAAVGSLAVVAGAMSPAAARTDLEGRTLFPGLVDAHSHSVDGGLGLISADATEKVSTVAELVAFAAEAKRSGRGMQGGILVVSGLPLELWSHNEELNAKFGAGEYASLPVLLEGMDGHTEWANAALLKRAGITEAYLQKLTATERSYFGVGKDGGPNGFLVDAGKHRVDALIPAPDDARLLAAGRAALQYEYSLGITAWLDPLASKDVLKTYKMLIDKGELKSEVDAFPQVYAKDPVVELAAVEKIRAAYAGLANLHISGIKVFADGVAEFPSQTAHLTQPYKNSGKNGELLFEPGKFAELCVAADKAGLIVHVHAIGDGAVKASLDGIAAARAANPRSQLPHTLTHEQFVDPEDVERLAHLKVFSALQLYWAKAEPDTIELLKPYVAEGIYRWQYPARSMLDAGATIAGASDWPVSTANVFRAIYQAETRKGPDGVLDAGQAVPRLAMFYAYTRNAAAAMGLDSIGSIAVGKRADLVVLDRDVLTVPAEEMREAKVLKTLVGGKVVYEAGR